MNLLFVSNLLPRPDDPLRGAFNAAFVAALQRQLRERGGGLRLLVPVPCSRRSREREIRNWRPPSSLTGIPVRYIPYFHLPVVGRNLAWRWHRAALLRDGADALAWADAMVGSWLYPDAVALQAVAAAQSKPCWIRLHGTDRFHLDAWFRGRRSRDALARAAGIAVNAESMRDALRRRGVDGSRIAVIPNGLDRASFHPRRLPAAAVRQGILWIGNLVSVKNPVLALQSFAQLGVESDVPLAIIGSGPLRPSLERLALELGIAGRVRFAGQMGRDAVAELLRGAKLLLLTSRSEGMPNVVLEALASGTPVVATAVGDVPVMVRDGENGVLVEPTLPADRLAARLAAGMRRVLEQTWPPEAIAGSLRVGDWDDAASAFLTLVEGTVKQGAPL